MPHSENPSDDGVEPERLEPEQLYLPFTSSCKPSHRFRVGIEHERFGLKKQGLVPLQYEGDDGVVGLFREFVTRFGWEEHRETKLGPVVSLHRGEAAITLEPAAQFEFSGSPCVDLHVLEDERRGHAEELRAISEDKGIVWIAPGFHPLARHDQLPWVPKLRYGVMRHYLAEQGVDALEMMRRTATVQANFDYDGIEDALRKLRVGLRLSPIVSAMFANGPFVEGRRYGGRSRRVQTWLHVDPARQGLLPMMWGSDSTLDDYIDWALRAPMFMFIRNGRVARNTGQPFRDFMRDGFEGYYPTYSDWTTHLNTLFPEIRLKQTIEARGADSVPDRYASALPAIWTGIFYDAEALGKAEDMTHNWSCSAAAELRRRLGREGMTAVFEGKRVAYWAERLLDLAREGLVRRGRLDMMGTGEEMYLDALGKLVERGMSPADEVLEVLEVVGEEDLAEGLVGAMAVWG